MNLKKSHILFILCVLLGISGFAQQQLTGDYAPGEVLIQLDCDLNKTQLISTHTAINLQQIEVVSERFHIYRLSFDQSRMSQANVLESLAEKPAVIHVQNNHYISLRGNDELIPDDSLFTDQWALRNEGQSGGVAGADIDASLAWDITTGGVTAHGDTIVVAIIDGGGFLSHEDLSHWKNRHEIPNNNIDDDNNGYVDDYDGWNAFTNSDQIPTHDHGTHVAGITGAIGNNHIGVTGVNWNLKVLPIVASSTIESIVVKGLDYVFTLRKQYDETNGEQGAFIVADNCSFGVDQGNPNSFPIWEAMYDSLGSLGILSMGATANKAWDIDETGDVPTGFTTDYMIAVTNTNHFDELYGAAGWGDTTIDLSAPGTHIMSTKIANNYGYKTGTSMATPQVTGAMALLMAAADSAFISYYKANPAEAALMIRDYILNGVDTLSALTGKTVTGGRLNVYNSINLLLLNPLSTDVGSVKDSLLVNTITKDTVVLTNNSLDTVAYTRFIPNQPQWISLSTVQGILAPDSSENIIMQLNALGLDTGNYSCEIHINSAGENDLIIPVSLYVFTDVGIAENREDRVLVKAFPNPFNDHLNFELVMEHSSICVLDIYDEYGTLVSSEEMQFGGGSNHFTKDYSSLAKGVYLYQFSMGGRPVNVGKIIKR